MSLPRHSATRPRGDPADDLAAAHQAHQAGRLAEAEAGYQAVLAAHPTLADAWQLLGFLRLQQARHAEALDCYDRALQGGPQPAFHLYRGECLYHLGRFPEAREALTRGAAAPGGEAESAFYLALTHYRLAQPDQAAVFLRRSLLRPDLPPEQVDCLCRLLLDTGGAGTVEEWLRTELAGAGDLAPASYALGQLRQAAGAPEEAEPLLARAVREFSGHAEVHYQHGRCLRDLRRIPAATAALQRAAQLRPTHLDALNYLAMCLTDGDRLNEAVAIHLEALKVNPDFIPCLNNAAGCLTRQGKIEPALGFYRRLVELSPHQFLFHSNLLLTLNYAWSESPETIAAAHRRFGREAAAQPLGEPYRRPAPRPAGRPLRVGFVSADLRHHPVVSWLEGWLPHLPRERLEPVAFSLNERDDGHTARLRPAFAQWHDLRDQSHAQALETIRAAAVDLLVDLSGHTARNLLPVFAARAAPAQLTMLGYPNTTGLDTVDFRWTDAWADPPGRTEALHTERLFRAPRCAWCFTPPPEAPAPTRAERGPEPVFGCFNNLAKIRPELVAEWAALLHAVPGSRLLIKSSGLQDPHLQRYYRRLFEARAIAPERLLLVGRTRSPAEHFAWYGQVDVALDSYPYHGTTTTAEALWMGVPVVSRIGPDHRSRVGLSLLSAAGRPEDAVESWEDYRARAAALASQAGAGSDPARQELRRQMAASPLCDAAGFAAVFTEAAAVLAAAAG